MSVSSKECSCKQISIITSCCLAPHTNSGTPQPESAGLYGALLRSPTTKPGESLRPWLSLLLSSLWFLVLITWWADTDLSPCFLQKVKKTSVQLNCPSTFTIESATGSPASTPSSTHSSTSFFATTLARSSADLFSAPVRVRECGRGRKSQLFPKAEVQTCRHLMQILICLCTACARTLWIFSHSIRENVLSGQALTNCLSPLWWHRWSVRDITGMRHSHVLWFIVSRNYEFQTDERDANQQVSVYCLNILGCLWWVQLYSFY